MKIARFFAVTVVLSAALSCTSTTRVRVIPVDTKGARTTTSAHVELDGVLVGAAPLVLEVERGERTFALVQDSRRRGCKVDVAGRRMHVRVQTPPSSTEDSAGAPEKWGSMEPAAIDRRIKQRLNELKYCYDRELPRKPRLAGKVVIHFSIAVDGAVEYAFAKYSTMADENEECVAHVFRTFRFDPPNNDGRVTVNYPLFFSSGPR